MTVLIVLYDSLALRGNTMPAGHKDTLEPQGLSSNHEEVPTLP